MARKNKKRMTVDQKHDRRARRIRNWIGLPLQLIGLTTLGIGIGFSGYVATRFVKTSPALAIRTIEVRGAKRTSIKEILAAGGLEKGMNIFKVDMNEVGKRVRDLPWVQNARVSRIVPDRILVEVEEHIPIAVMLLDEVYFINSQAEVFKRAQAGDMLDLPAITGLARKDFRQDLQRTRKTLLQVFRLIEQFESQPCFENRILAEVHCDELMGFSIVIDPGATLVRLGKRDLKDQGPILCELFSELEDQNLQARMVLLDHPQRPGWATVRLNGKADLLGRMDDR